MLCFTGVPLQGHFKVTARANWPKTWFLGFLSIPNPFGVQINITNDCCRHIIGRVPLYHASQGVCMQFQPWGGGVITNLVFPLSHPFPKAGMNQQNYWNVAVWNRSLSPHDNISMDTELIMKGGMNWCCALLGVSPQGHINFNGRSNW